MAEDEAVKTLKQAMSFFLDMALRELTLERVLVDKKLLTPDEVQSQLDRLNQIPAIQAARKAYETDAPSIEELLRKYEGTVH